MLLDFSVGGTTFTFTWTLAIWTLISASALLVGSFLIQYGFSNLRALEESGLNGVRRYYVWTQIIRELGRCTVQLLFLALGLYSATLPPPPPHHRSTQEWIFLSFFISAVAIILLVSIVDWIRYREVERKLRVQIDGGSS